MSESDRTTDLTFLQFENSDLRTRVDADGLIWWVAADVCRILHVVDTAQAVARLDSDERGTCLIRTPYGPQEMVMVNEPGLYTLILTSRKKIFPEVHRFKRWVFHEVLPTLRRTGTYTVPSRPAVKPSNHLPPPDRPVQEMAHVSEMLLSVWTTLRQAEDPLTNTEIARQTRVPLRTVQRHTKYLLQIGLIDLYETRPSHLFLMAEHAAKRHAGYFQRLERIAQIMDQRQRRLFA
jgi:prophage antirepressor-like protein